MISGPNGFFEEKDLDAFTVGVRLPVILLSYINKKDTKDVEYAVSILGFWKYIYSQEKLYRYFL